jgi:hypothetical protein
MARAAERAAVMPLSAEALLPSAREGLEADLRAAITSLGVELQDAERTKVHVDSAMKSGLDCSLARDDCAVRVGLVAGVDVVVTASVEVVGERTLFRAAWLPVQGKPARRVAGAFTLPALDGGKSLGNLVKLLVTGKGQPAPVPVRIDVDPVTASLAVDGKSAASGISWLLPGPHALHAEAAGRVAVDKRLVVSSEGDDEPVILVLPPIPTEEPFPATFAAGVGLGVTGAALAVASGAAIAFIENDLSNVKRIEDREPEKLLGQAAIAGAAIGGALAVSGVVLVVMGALE